MSKPLIFSLCKISDKMNTNVVWMAGVCAGIAYTLNMPTWFVRLFFFVFGLLTAGLAVVIYLMLAIFLPALPCPDDFYQKTHTSKD